MSENVELRGEAPYVIVSPHLDDAVLSCGQLMAAHPGCMVVTVFAGFHQLGSEVSTEYDRQSGWQHADEAVIGRRDEDRHACAVLRARPHWLPFVDWQYVEDGLRIGETDDLEQMLRLLLRPEDTLVFPLGLVHPDHEFVSRVCLNLRHPLSIMYEELPYRVLHPREAASAANYERPVLIECAPVAGPLHLKEAAVACYRSQRWALEQQTPGLHACFVPERYWRVAWDLT